MKTTVIMKRVLGNHLIRQESKDGMFNANDLLAVYKKQTHKTKKRLDHFMKRDETKDMVEALIRRLNQAYPNRVYIEENIIVKSKAKKGDKGGTWMHPYLFIDFAMWLSVDFKILCIEWIHDHLIQLRNDVGDDYKEFTAAIKEHLQPTDVEVYKNEIGMVNKLVFGTMDAGQRNVATTEQLALLKTLQKADMKLMAEGKDYSQRMTSLFRLKQLL